MILTINEMTKKKGRIRVFDSLKSIDDVLTDVG